MKLIRKLIAEDGAGGAVGGGAAGSVGAGSIAGFATPLFVALTKRANPIKISYTKKKKEKKVQKGFGIREEFYKLTEQDDDAHQVGQDTFDTTEVIAKLKGLENKDAVDKNETQAFVLEDDEGNMVKIWVKADQAANFEATLNAVLSQEDEHEKRGVPEIAEILFKLKDRFDIVDVEFPEVAEDEEQEVSLAGGAPGMPGEPGAEGAPQPGAEGEMGDISAEDLTPGGEGGEAGEGEVKSLLGQVIDMMKADAEARKADAHARQAEAKAREADLGRQQIVAKVKQEEQFLDMETEQKAKKEADKEAKRLAQLARWKHETEQDQGTTFDEEPAPAAAPAQAAAPALPGREEEEMQHPAAMHKQPAKKGANIRGRVSPSEVAKYILGRVK